ncbi:MAG: heme exporter protein CcmD [Pseudomonadota bacterium]
MDKYAVYVWTCYAITAAVLVINAWQARAKHRRVYRDIEVRIKALGDD